MCTMLVDGEKINTLIDTGAAATLISGTPKTSKFTTACIVGVTGMPKTVYVEPRTLKIGSKTIRSDVFLEKDALSLLGALDIVKFGFIIDLMNHMLWNIEGSTSPSEHTRIGLGSNLPPVHVVYPHEDVGAVKGIKIKHPPAPPVDTESWWHEYADVWAKDSLDCGKSQLMVSLDGTHHPYVKQYPIPREAEKDLEVIIDQLLQRGLIRPCQTAGSSPVWPIRKKDNTWRLTIDYRRLNETVFRTAPVVASYPELIAKLTPEMQYYTVLDLANGFYSVQVTPETQYRTAFAFQSKQYCWTVLPQGYCDSPAIFHSMLAQALKSHNLHNKIVQYVDDLLIANDSRESNIKLLKKVLECLKKHGLKLNPDKCQLVQQKVNYLGLELGPTGRSILEDRVKHILSLPRPVDVKSLQQFLGLTGFCREFVANYALLAEPLSDLLKQNKFEWNDSHTQTFSSLKSALASAPVLGTPASDKPFYLYSSVSDTTLGAVVAQYHGDILAPIAYLSRKMTSPELKFGPCEKIALATYWTIQRLRYLLSGQHIVIRSHHNPLLLLKKHNLALSDIRNERVVRWMTTLLTEHITVEPLKEPSVHVLGVLIQGQDHVCHPMIAPKAHSVFKEGSPADVGNNPVWYIDASSSVIDGTRMTGFAGVLLEGRTILDLFQYACKNAGAQFAELAALLTLIRDKIGKGGTHFVVTDSMYVFRGALILLTFWVNNKWQSTDGSIVQHKGLWERIQDLSKDHVGFIKLVKVKAHRSKGPLAYGNSLADKFAKEAACLPDIPLWEEEDVLYHTPLAPVQLSAPDDDDTRWSVLREHQEYDLVLAPLFDDLAPKLGKETLKILHDILVKDTEHGPVWVIPSHLVKCLLAWVHGSIAGGHPKLQECMDRMSKLGWWPTMRRDIQDHIDRCIVCAHQDPARQLTRGALMRHAPTGPWDRLQVDYVGTLPLTARKNRYILVVVDSFSRWIEAFATPNKTAGTTAKILVQNVFCHFGIPKQMDSDNGGEFVNTILKEITSWLDLPWDFHIAYHPQSRGMVERMNGQIKKELSKICNANGKNWDILLPFVLARMRSRVNRHIQMSPYEVLFGRSMPSWERLLLPMDISTSVALCNEEWAKEHSLWLTTVQGQALHTDAVSALKSKSDFDKKSDLTEYQVGDSVCMLKQGQKNPRKFPKDCWEGPYLIVDKKVYKETETLERLFQTLLFTMNDRRLYI
ncbi:NYNRIN-like [Pelobates cultripes]|uniref:Gypsy retrotransposon integrase-like protein 1 n=1 Tax=Pelobates cultripes TaxID=61616 RepID=A0AAD1S5G0_PELCU|nr:NYNRIN-like [Pelobates cultripes]